MGNYANKTCYDCGVKQPANQMERVTESFNSGRSDNKVTAGNLAWAAVSDTAAKKVKKTIVANNRRSYTRNREVWKCYECSGENKIRRADVVKNINKAMKAVKSARNGGIFSKKKVISPEIECKLETLEKMRGETLRSKSKELRLEIQSMLKDAPINWGDDVVTPEVVEQGEAPVVKEVEVIKEVEVVKEVKVIKEVEVVESEVVQKAKAEAAEYAAFKEARAIEDAAWNEAQRLKPLVWYYKVMCWWGMFAGALFGLMVFMPSTPDNPAPMPVKVFIGIIAAAMLYPSIKALYFRPYNIVARKARNAQKVDISS